MSRPALLLLTLTLAPGTALADLEPDSQEWNGLARWVTGMRDADLEVRTPERLDLDTVAPTAGVALLGPDFSAVTLDGPHLIALRRWVEQGGRLLVAAEGPEADPVLKLFDARDAGTPAAGRHLGGHPALRVLSGPGRGVLFRGVDDVVTNRPRALMTATHLIPQIRFASPADRPEEVVGFAYHLRLGAGEVALLGDASVLINLMLDAGDNARLAANLGSWLTRDGGNPVYLLGPAGVVSGGGPRAADRESAVAALNRTLGALSQHGAPDRLAVHILLALLLAACVLYLLTVFPGGEPQADAISPPSHASGAVERAAGRPRGPADPEALGSEPIPTAEERSSS